MLGQNGHTSIKLSFYMADKSISDVCCVLDNGLTL